MLLIATFLLFLQDDDSRPQALKDLDAARQDLQILQMLNEVNLRADQIEKILEGVEEAHRILQTFAQDNQVVLADMTQALADAKAVLERGETISEEAKQSMADIERSVRDRSQEMQAQLQKAAEKTRSVMDEKQLRRLAYFGKPDPVRNELRKGLGQIRVLSDEDFETKVPQAINARVEKLGGLSQQEIDAERDRILAVLVEVRSADDETFAKKTEEFVDKIVSEGKMGEALRKAAPQGADAEKQINKLLMSSRFGALLKRRLEILKK